MLTDICMIDYITGEILDSWAFCGYLWTHTISEPEVFWKWRQTPRTQLETANTPIT